MSKPLTIDPAVLQRLRKLPETDRGECLLALCELVDTFGRPHTHAGLGIRKLGNKLFESRGNARVRFILQDRPDDLFVSFMGNHDEVRALLKSGKYR